MELMNPVGFSGRNWRNVQPAQSQNRLPSQSVSGKAVVNQPIHFGLGLFLEQAGQAMLGKGLEGIIDDSKKLAKLGNLSKNFDYRNGMSNLELALNAGSTEEKKNYLERAEEGFTKAANKQHYKILAATCWMYAAQCAELGGKSQGVIGVLCQNAENAFENSREQILKERADLIRPFKLSNMPRLILSSPVWAILTPVYLFSQPHGSTARRVREHLIKHGYGEQEWKCVEQNELLARRFNNSQGLLDTLSRLQGTQAWKFDDRQAIPEEVPLFVSGSDSWRGQEAARQQAASPIRDGNRAIVPSAVIDPLMPEDIV